jgi:hypothetical protein
MVVYETIIVVNGEVHARITEDEKSALQYAEHIAWAYLGRATASRNDTADAVQEMIIDDDRVAYADVAVERRLY